jgi:hypothetical protein
LVAGEESSEECEGLIRGDRHVSRWLVDVVSAAAEIFSVSASNWSKRLAPGSTSGTGKRIMLPKIRIEFVS